MKKAKKRLRVYVARPISGYRYTDISNWYTKVARYLQRLGYEVYTPLVAKDESKLASQRIKPCGYREPTLRDDAICKRDEWMIRKADVVFMYLKGAESPSIGCCMELGWSMILNKHSVVVMGSRNIHHHAFVHTAASIIFNNIREAKDYMRSLIE